MVVIDLFPGSCVHEQKRTNRTTIQYCTPFGRMEISYGQHVHLWDVNGTLTSVTCITVYGFMAVLQTQVQDTGCENQKRRRVELTNSTLCFPQSLRI